MLRALLLASLLVSCGDGGGEDEEPFDTFQDCFDDHHIEEAFNSADSIAICCLDHPIGGQDANIVCGESAADCEAFVDLELDDQTDVTLPDIEAGCADYISERDL
jgi:hypothetical protein